jgi:hypothetical protein
MCESDEDIAVRNPTTDSFLQGIVRQTIVLHVDLDGPIPPLEVRGIV